MSEGIADQHSAIGAIVARKQKPNVPKLRFPEFDDEWKIQSIGERLERVIDYRGKAPPKTESGVPLITARNVRCGHLDFLNDEYIDQYQYEDWMNRGLPLPFDVLFTTEAPLGNVCFYPETGTYALGQRIITLRADVNILSNFFLFQFLMSPTGRRRIDKKSTGSTAKGIKSREFLKIPMAAPEPTEQKKIAAFLGAVDRKITALRERRDLLTRYKRGLMQKLFSQTLRFTRDDGTPYPDWEEKRLGDVAMIYDGTHQTPKYVKSGIPFYSVEHVTSDNFSTTKFIAEDVFEKESKRVVIKRGDILMTRIGDIGTSKYIDWNVRASFYVSLALIKCVPPIQSSYVHQFSKSSIFQKELWKRTIHVAFPKKINLGEISHCLIKVPHPDEQQKIATALQAMDAKIDAVAAEIDQIETFKKGLLQQMFV